jgi:hypothetical protein
VSRDNCTISIDIDVDALPAVISTIHDVEVEAGTGITVSGIGEPGTPYIISNSGVWSVNGLVGNVTIDDPDGSETIVTAGTGITVTGVGTVGDPYVIESTVTAGTTYDGTETKVTVGAGLSISGLGSTPSPYLLTNTGVLSVNGLTGAVTVPTYDGSETIVQAGTNVTVSGTGTAVDPYIVNAATGATSLAGCDFTWVPGFTQVAGGTYVGAQFVYKPGVFAKWRGNVLYDAAAGVSKTYTKFVTTVPLGVGTCPASGPYGVAYPTGQTRREFFVFGTNTADDLYTFKVYTNTIGEYYIRAVGSNYPVDIYTINLEPIHFEIN